MSMQQHLEHTNPELATFTGHASAVTIIVYKIHQAHQGLNHALRTQTPKTQLRERLIRLEQMIADWMYFTGRWNFGGSVRDQALVDTAAVILKINIERLRTEIRR